jgi:hypothetical protein
MLHENYIDMDTDMATDTGTDTGMDIHVLHQMHFDIRHM